MYCMHEHTQIHEHEKHRNKDEHSVGHNKEATQHDISRFPAFRVCAYVYEALRVFSDYFCPRNREMPNSCNYPVFCLLVSRDPFARSLVARGLVAKGPVAKGLAHFLHKNCAKSDQKYKNCWFFDFPEFSFFFWPKTANFGTLGGGLGALKLGAGAEIRL